MATARRRGRRGKAAPAGIFRRVLRVALWIAFVTGAVGATLLAGYLWYLDRTLTDVFEGRRWSLPAQVYAAPLEVHPGSLLKQAAFRAELERSGYTRATSTRHPGSWAEDGDTVSVYLREFQFDDHLRPPQRIAVKFRAQGIVDVTSDDGMGVPLIRLDPPIIGSIFPAHGEDRIVLAPDQVPALLSEGLKAVEDKNFDTHAGFSIRGMARAAWVNLTSGELSQGGSTLTQQLVKSYFLDNSRTIERKLHELAMAVVLEWRFSKQDLLNAYINEIFLGQNGNRAIHGFGLGAQFYFNKPLGELAPNEIATLIAIIRGPSYYDPFRHAERALERRNRILATFADEGLLDAGVAERESRQPLGVTSRQRRGGRYYPAFMDVVRANLVQNYSRDDLSSQGLRVFSTLQPRLQESIQRHIAERLAALEKARKIDSLEAAVVILDVQTGELLALAGGRQAGFEGFNRALNASRPVGSLMKPLVVLAAIEAGHPLTEIVHDAPITVPLSRTKSWTPDNFDKRVHGPVPIVKLLGDSLNLATVRLSQEVGMNTILALYTRMTDRKPANPNPSFVLGAEPLSPLDVARLYATIANGGFRMPVKAVTAVLDEAGQPLYEQPFEMQQVVATADAEALSYVLEGGMRLGTGKGSRHSNAGAAGKTGTSNDFRDSWFAGFDARKVGIVWVGRDDNKVTGLTGSTGALAIWDPIFTDLGIDPIVHAEETSVRDVEYDTGLLASPDCAITVRVPLRDPDTLPVKEGCGIKPAEEDRWRWPWWNN
ncbi:MAG: transglycosylase domain-containing protein [Pseudomonadales bacterium]|nr:transglycosylase domain-containing protein [Pseudomonadales bacterium]MCP5186050.1 transglycosylase domain-containing protein [Pseudomonadales bacterium]